MRSFRRRSLAPAAVAVALVAALPFAAPSQGGTRSALDAVAVPAFAADVAAAPPAGPGYAPGAAIPVTGRLYDVSGTAANLVRTPVEGQVRLRVRRPDGSVAGTYGPYATAPDGTFAATIPGAATAGLVPKAATGYRLAPAVDVLVGEEQAGTTAVTVAAAPDDLVLENSFVSSVGWVKPGESYPFRVFVRNFGGAAKTGASVAIEPVPGMSFTEVATVGGGSDTAAIVDGNVRWTIGAVEAATEDSPGLKTLIVQARAMTTGEDDEIVWKDLSTTATLTWDGGTATSMSHGPKVIPPGDAYETARYGDRPFPVVPVDYQDLKHLPDNDSERLDGLINDPAVPGSTFNLYQEMSLKQLFPHGTVPSVGLASETFDHEFTNPMYADGWSFTEPAINADPKTCAIPLDRTYGSTPQVIGTEVYKERIRDGWYQMPGSVGYYGRDKYVTALAGQVAPSLQVIDAGCGDTGKAVFDAAHIADPEIDYSDYDTDKDGVVDFFMLIYAGRGGHGASQTATPADCDAANQPVDCAYYDNIWPHSSSLEFSYVDTETGLSGYISDDQLKDLEGRPLYYTDESYSQMTTDVTERPVFVRVGPYNVNPETSIAKASVISHEYGHSLGLPDYYTIGDRETYGDWSLMATDKSQNMDVIGKKELGWTVPRPVKPGQVSGWQDSKVDTNRIDWVTEDGKSYFLSGPGVHNSETYQVYLPGRRQLDPAKVQQGASPSHVWWSGSGNDFGCPPEKGRNLDIALHDLAKYPEGTEVTLTFNSYWDIEWDYDYGYVLIGSNDERGQVSSYSSVPSANGWSTPAATNPNGNACQSKYGNGLTGTSGSWDAGTQEADRRGISSNVPGGTDYPDGPFLPDEYDISALAGKEGAVLRFAYATDPGLARPGWFIDDIKVTAGDDVVYETDFERTGSPRDARVYSGGCKDTTKVAKRCTRGWQYVEAGAASVAEHAYLLEMRDRSGFDEEGKGQNDRAAIGFLPGLLLTYTDEAHGYGNVGTDDPPAQSPLDAAPTPGDNTPDLNDAAFGAGQSYSDGGEGHVDNYEDPNSESGNWEFRHDCLSFDVTGMAGEGMGPSVVGGEDTLVGDVRFRTGRGCAAFDYGYGGEAGPSAPVARIQVKPATAEPGEQVTFDGSRSFDAQQSPGQLKYEWDFTSDGTVDATGQTVRHAYDKAGRYRVTLTVTDADGMKSTASADVVIQAARQERPTGGLPATGAPATLAMTALAATAAALGLRRARRE